MEYLSKIKNKVDVTSNIALGYIDNDLSSSVLVALIIVCASQTDLVLPKWVRTLFNSSIFRFVYLSLLLMIPFKKAPHLAIAVAVLFVVIFEILKRTERFENMAGDVARNIGGDNNTVSMKLFDENNSVTCSLTCNSGEGVAKPIPTLRRIQDQGNKEQTQDQSESPSNESNHSEPQTSGHQHVLSKRFHDKVNNVLNDKLADGSITHEYEREARTDFMELKTLMQEQENGNMEIQNELKDLRRELDEKYSSLFTEIMHKNNSSQSQSILN
jgi:hypothetical protein